jgi:hypothetical protein
VREHRYSCRTLDARYPKNTSKDTWELFMSITNENSPEVTEAAIQAKSNNVILTHPDIPIKNVDPYRNQESMESDKSSFESNTIENFLLQKFSLNGQSKEMKKQMLEDKYILGRIAIYGQYTVFYASPNVGKTLLVLWMLIKSIQSGGINASDVFYINADDDHKGLTYKVELAERYGFQMLAPSYRGFDPAKFFQYIQSMNDNGSAKGKVIVLDTLKKFTDVMSKDKSSEFGKLMRGFVMRGGSIICLGHTNKHKDLTGKSVYGGTSDIADDADCYYMLEEIQVNEKSKTVRFENRKSRGDVDKTATFIYSNKKVTNYQELLNSVQTVSESEAEAIAQINAMNNRLSTNQEFIRSIETAINSGITLKTNLIKSVASDLCVGASKVKRVLDLHTGTTYSKGDRWTFVTGDKNSQTYSLLSPDSGSSYQDLM